MKPTSFPLPTPPDIMENSEIAMLYLLFEFLEVASRTIIAAHPILACQDRPPWIDFAPDDEAAKLLLSNLERLAKSILVYKKSITPLSPLGDGLYSGIPAKPLKNGKRRSLLRQLNLPFSESEAPPF